MTQIGLIFCAIALLHNGVLALDCFERDIDYDGTNINNGLEQKTDNEVNCQQLCKHIIGCEGFTWASSNFAGVSIFCLFFFALHLLMYNFSDVDYRNACWLKKDIIGKYAKNEALSGPKECGSDGNCCDLVYFGSTGSMDGSVQNHVIGNYEKTSEGPEGHWNYKQQGGKLVMYYVPWLEVSI
jgi:hypothetical protein